MNWTVLKAFIVKELRQTLRDPRMRSMLIMAPVIQLTLFGFALRNEVKNIRLAVYAAPSDSVAWDLARRAEGSGWFKLVEAPSPDPYLALRGGDVDAALVAPAGGLTRAMGRGQGNLQVLVDGSNTVRAQGVVNYLEQARQALLKERLTAGGGTPPPRLQMNPRFLYNPTLESKLFMVPGVLAMLMVLLTLTLTSSSLTREKERGTYETLLAAPIDPMTILLGKSIPYVILGLLDMPLILAVAHFGFDVPVRGGLLQLYIATLAFVGSTVALGILVSTVAQNQQQAMMGGFLTLYPAQMLSGIVYPLENMPKWLVWITYFNPLRYYATLVRNILLKGGSPRILWSNVGALVLLGSFLLFLAYKRFKPTLN